MKKLPTVALGFELLFLLKLPQPDLGLGGITAFGIVLVASDFFILLITFVTLIFNPFPSYGNLSSCDECDPFSDR